MASQHRVEAVEIPTSGLSYKSEPYFAPKNTLSGAYNIRPYKGGLYTVGVIQSSKTTASTAIPNGAGYLRTSEGDRAAVLATAINFERYDAGTSTWIDITPTSGPTNGTATDLWSFAESWSWLYGSNGIDGIWRYNGSGDFELFDANYNARYLQGFAGRLFLADVEGPDGAFRDRVHWSTAAETPSLDDGGFTDLLDVDGPITGMLGVGTALYVHKLDAIWRVTETGVRLPEFTFQLVYQGPGSVGGRTLRRCPLGQIFLGSDLNVYLFDGVSQPTAIGDDVSEYIRDNLNHTSIPRVYGEIIPGLDEYWLCIPTGSDTWSDTILTWNWKTGSWGVYKPGVDVTVIGWRSTTEIVDTWGSETVLEWGSETAKTWGSVLDVGEDLQHWLGRSNNTTIELNFTAQSGTVTGGWNFETQDDPINSAGKDKTLYRLVLHGTFPVTANISAYVSTDGGQTYSGAKNVNITGSANTQRAIWNYTTDRVTAENFRFKFSGTAPAYMHFLQVHVGDREEIR